MISGHKKNAIRRVDSSERRHFINQMRHAAIDQVSRYRNQVWLEGSDAFGDQAGKTLIENWAYVNVRDLHDSKTVEGLWELLECDLDTLCYGGREAPSQRKH